MHQSEAIKTTKLFNHIEHLSNAIGGIEKVILQADSEKPDKFFLRFFNGKSHLEAILAREDFETDSNQGFEQVKEFFNQLNLAPNSNSDRALI